MARPTLLWPRALDTVGAEIYAHLQAGDVPHMDLDRGSQISQGNEQQDRQSLTPLPPLATWHA
jgi:hypothetical protein